MPDAPWPTKSLSKHVQDVIDENWARCQHTPERTEQLEALRDVRAVLEAVLEGIITERATRILELDGPPESHPFGYGAFDSQGIHKQGWEHELNVKPPFVAYPSPCCGKESTPDYRGESITFMLCPCGQRWKP